MGEGAYFKMWLFEPTMSLLSVQLLPSKESLLFTLITRFGVFKSLTIIKDGATYQICVVLLCRPSDQPKIKQCVQSS